MAQRIQHGQATQLIALSASSTRGAPELNIEKRLNPNLTCGTSFWGRSGNVYEKSKNYREIHASSKLILAYVKRMSDRNKINDYYEEMEWRIVHHANDKIIKNTVNDIHRLKFEMSDIEVIVFPDRKTKKLSLEDNYIKECLSRHMPIIAVLDDCLNF